MYKIVGADNKVYGPVSREEALQWIAEGRANARTIVRIDDGPWKPMATFEEFKAALNVPSAAVPPAGGFTTIPPTVSEVPVTPGAKANSAAIAGVVFGVLGICCCPLLGSTLAIILGVVGLNQIKAKPGAYTTNATIAKVAIGLGIAGFVLQCAYYFLGGFAALEKFIKSR
jgi:hypothetical protein